MRTRLLLAAVCMLTLPLWLSASRKDKFTEPAPFATVAYAGHTIAGDWCDCGTPGCICGGGGLVNRSNDPMSSQAEELSIQGASPIRANSGFDFGSAALILGLAIFVWVRLRA